MDLYLIHWSASYPSCPGGHGSRLLKVVLCSFDMCSLFFENLFLTAVLELELNRICGKFFRKCVSHSYLVGSLESSIGRVFTS